jgi:hypothetical protein
MSGSHGDRRVIAPLTTRELRLRAADEKMAAAKSQFTAAALACMRGDFDRVKQVQAALDLVASAREEIARLHDLDVDAEKPYA